MFDDPVYTALCSAITLQSHKDGFFQLIMDDIIQSVGAEWISNFGQLNSNKERLVRCMIDQKIRKHVVQMSNNVQEIYRGKNAHMSKQQREEAEHLRKKEKLDKALLLYTQSVIKAPATDENENESNLSMALWGRSSILFAQRRYSCCLEDVKLCLREKLPNKLKLDAYWRMAECYFELNQLRETRVTLSILLKLVESKDYSGAAGGDSWKEKIERKFEDVKKVETGANVSLLVRGNESTASSAALSDGSHTDFQDASKKVQLSRSETGGNYFISQENIRTGDTLLIEDPYVTCLLPDKFGTHCHHCSRRFDIAYPCTDCSAIAFCSVSCRTVSLRSYHKYECHYLDLLIGSGMSILCFAALRIMTQRSLSYFQEFKKPENASCGYNKMLNMIGHEDKRTTADFLSRTIMALFLLSVLKKSGFFGQSRKVDNMGSQELMIGCMLLRNLEILQFNAHEIFEPVRLKSNPNCLKPLNIGIGLYLTASFFNHDCYPAITRYFDGTKLIIKAVRPVQKNDIVGDNYGLTYTKHNLVERQRKLSSRYWFQCECNACSEDWPKFSEILKIKCTQCCKISYISHGSRNVSELCKYCGTLLKLAEVQALKENIQQKLSEFRGTDEEAKVLYKLQDLISTYLEPPSRIFENIQEKLVQYFMSFGNVYVS